jgi:hypothetical protein
MNRRRLGLVGLGVVIAACVPAAGSFAQTPARDSVSAHGDASAPGSTCTDDFFDPCFLFELDASSEPSGTDATGNVHVSLSTFDHGYSADGPVSCLAVTGSRAVIGVQTDFTVVGNRVLGVFVVAVDGGAAGSGLDTLDVINRLDLLGLPNTPPTDCTVAGLRATGDPVTHGDVVVVDAPEAPTSKDQCKNGGWRNFPAFKNQGGCVSFVATKRQTPPAG